MTIFLNQYCFAAWILSGISAVQLHSVGGSRVWQISGNLVFCQVQVWKMVSVSLWLVHYFLLFSQTNSSTCYYLYNFYINTWYIIDKKLLKHVAGAVKSLFCSCEIIFNKDGNKNILQIVYTQVQMTLIYKGERYWYWWCSAVQCSAVQFSIIQCRAANAVECNSGCCNTVQWKLFRYRCYSRHTLRDSVSPVCLKKKIH